MSMFTIGSKFFVVDFGYQKKWLSMFYDYQCVLLTQELFSTGAIGGIFQCDDLNYMPF